MKPKLNRLGNIHRYNNKFHSKSLLILPISCPSDLKKQFTISPSPTSVEAGSAASLRCSPPAAAPAPRVTWLKHGAPLQQDHNVLISAEGNLLISRASLQVSIT